MDRFELKELEEKAKDYVRETLMLNEELDPTFKAMEETYIAASNEILKDLKNKLSDFKDVELKIANECIEKYKKSNDDTISLNMFYNAIISYNNYEKILAELENRPAVAMFFGKPPHFSEKTVEINIQQMSKN